MRIKIDVALLCQNLNKSEISRLKQELNNQERYLKHLAKENPDRNGESRKIYSIRVSSETGLSMEICSRIWDYLPGG